MAPNRPVTGSDKRRRGRPPGSRKTEVAIKPKQRTAPSMTIAKRRKPSGVGVQDKHATKTATQTQTSRPRQRKAHNEIDEIAEEEPKSRKKYMQLEAKTKRIPHEHIETWPQVSPQALEQIVAVIRDAKKDIANTQRDERKIIAAHNTLNPLVRKLARQIAASRIPPQAKDIHFNVEKLTERNVQVSREVTTSRHSQQLLSEQVKVAKHLLRKDEENLEQLKKDAKKWRTEWKHQEKHGRVHPLLQEPDKATVHNDSPDAIGLRRSTPRDATLLDTPDADLGPVVEQLKRGLENMQGNHAPVEGIGRLIRDAQVALDDVLFRHASAQQYTTL